MLLIASEHKAEIEPLLKLYPFKKSSKLFKYDNISVFVNYGGGGLSLGYNIVDILSKNEDINIAVLFGFSGTLTDKLNIGDIFTLKRVKLIHNKKPVFNPVDLPNINELPSFEGLSLLDEYETDNSFLSLFADSIDKESYFFAKAVKSIGKFGIVLRAASDVNERNSIESVRTNGFVYNVRLVQNVIERLAWIEKDETMLEIFKHTGISNIKILNGLKRLIEIKKLTFTNRQKLYSKILINSKKENEEKAGFSVFIEKGVEKNRINLNLSKKKVVEIDDYVACFHNLKDKNGIVFANKKGEFLRKTPSNYTPSGSYGYSILNAYNCIYDCSYCFLKGYFRSFNPVIFLNYEDYFSAIKKTVQEDKARPLYFYSGTFSDSLAMAGFSNFNEKLIDFFREFTDEDIFLELRTKSDNINFLLETEPCRNIIVAFSLNPQPIIDRYEHLTPSLKKRMEAIELLDSAGYKIGVRLDPVFVERLNDYNELLTEINKIKNLHSIEVGFLRFDKNDYKNIIKKAPFILKNLVFDRGMYRYNKEFRERALEFFKTRLGKFYMNME